MSSTASFTKVLGIEEGIKCLTDVSFEQYRHLLFALSEDVNDDDNDSDSDNDNEGRSYSFSCYNIHSRKSFMFKSLEGEECTTLHIN